MLGRVEWGAGRRIELELEQLWDLPVLALTVPDRARGRERRLQKGARALAEHRVTRVLAPPGFQGWPVLLEQGLRCVDTQALRCALAPAWVKAALSARGIPPRRAILRLTGARESPDMGRVARALCPAVRNLIVDVPGGGSLALGLRREFGLPVLPARSVQADLTLVFDPGPVLAGAAFFLPGYPPPPCSCEILPLLSALWESGRIRTEEIGVQIGTLSGGPDPTLDTR